ncbi:MAG: selenide, water dikinase SelD, partial [Gammaproteobacteria bacterium]|nr:selenide, water dikinase SelD [Gammaproteobacteria bacterium]
RLPAKKIMAAQTIAPVLLREEDEDFSDKKIRCAGCGGKIAGDILSQVLAGLEIHQRADQLSGLETPDDAAIIDPAGQRLAQSVDQLRSMLDDPYVFAQIAANHALSDLYAMGAEPQSAMALITLPYAADRIQRRELAQLMHGCVDTLNQAGCTLSGGHTSEGAELGLGFVVNGLLTTAGALHKDGLRDGDLLILSKPLGSGVLLAADMQARAKGTDIQACIKQMQQSNRVAADIFKQYKTSAMTDITGFGLLGHLLEMLSASDVSCELEVEKIPLMSGALELSRQGIRSTLFPKNLRFAETSIDAGHWRKVSAHELLFDPQTSGGLLAGISETDSPDCLAALQQAGYSAATVIGKVTTCKKPASRINIA